ncbi:MAG: division/cell wall cluster transcriptional repressor MraZ [Nitrospira sp.]
MFLGTFHHSLDSKGRLSIPVKFREILNTESNGTIIMTTDLDLCLAAYPMNEWQSFMEKARKLPTMDKGVKRFFRFLFSSASECFLDRQGRVLIPLNLREYAGLNGNAVVVGGGSKFEVWNPGKWEENEVLVSENAPQIQGALAKLGM